MSWLQEPHWDCHDSVGPLVCSHLHTRLAVLHCHDMESLEGAEKLVRVYAWFGEAPVHQGQQIFIEALSINVFKLERYCAHCLKRRVLVFVRRLTSTGRYCLLILLSSAGSGHQKIQEESLQVWCTM